MRVSERVTTDEIKSWKDGDIIAIKAGTGRGKSYLIKNILYGFAKGLHNNKKILMLIHRVNCINQFQKEIEDANKTDVIKIESYQSLEFKIKNGIKLDFSEYAYIVCDEFHYFMSDAAFNKTTDISLNAILEASNKIRIFMSATGDYMKNYINNIKGLDTINYELPIDYDFIKTLTFFSKDETMEKFIDEAIEKGDKGIFFIQSDEKAYELHKKYPKHTLFNCSESNRKGYYKYVNKNKIAKMLSEEGFEEQILITTTTMDAGVNITDTKVQHIVCDIEDVGVLIQCIGRRRISDKIENDGIHVYIKNRSNKQLGWRKGQTNTKIKKAEYFKKNGNVEYVKKYGRDPDNNAIVYEDVNEDETDTIKKLNEMAYYKSLIDIATIEEMLSGSYITYISTLFDKKYRILAEEYEKEELENYLNEIVGQVMLTRNDRTNLINKINVRQNGKLLKSLESLNSALREQKIRFHIEQFETSRMVCGNKKNYKSAWRVLRLTDK